MKTLLAISLLALIGCDPPVDAVHKGPVIIFHAGESRTAGTLVDERDCGATVDTEEGQYNCVTNYLRIDK